MKRILFLTQGERETASSRHRVYQFLPILEKAGFESVIHPAVTSAEFQDAFISRSWQGNLKRVFRTFTRRVRDLHVLPDFDYIVVQKTILPAPLFNMELRIARQARMIFDFDDAIYTKKPGGLVISNLWPQAKRVTAICRRAHRVIVGNSELLDFAQKINKNATLIPTVVDTDAYATGSNLVKRAQKIPVIGWVGSPSTQSDLSLVVSALIDLHNRTPFVARVIGGIQSAMPVRFPIEWKSWNLKTEISDIAHLDYGLAPMKDTTWNRGKCGLKVLQYWAAGVPVVASPVGVYRDMIQDGENGLLAANSREWSEKLLLLIKNPQLRQKIIAAGKKTVEEKYSLKSATPLFLKTFEESSDKKEDVKKQSRSAETLEESEIAVLKT